MFRCLFLNSYIGQTTHKLVGVQARLIYNRFVLAERLVLEHQPSDAVPTASVNVAALLLEGVGVVVDGQTASSHKVCEVRLRFIQLF